MSDTTQRETKAARLNPFGLRHVYLLCFVSFSKCYFNLLTVLSRVHFWCHVGRFGNGQGQEFAEHFLLEYWRDSLAKWVRYKDAKTEEVGRTGLIDEFRCF